MMCRAVVNVWENENWAAEPLAEVMKVAPFVLWLRFHEG
jgi:hypothetical protein